MRRSLILFFFLPWSGELPPPKFGLPAIARKCALRHVRGPIPKDAPPATRDAKGRNTGGDDPARSSDFCDGEYCDREVGYESAVGRLFPDV